MTEQDKAGTASEPMSEADLEALMKAEAEKFLRAKPTAQLDKALRIVETHKEVFADIVNVGLFNGRQILHAEELQDQASRSHYSAEGGLHELERDVVKRWKTGDIRVACIGLENQSAPDPDMPLRVMGYDSAEYNLQVHSKSKERYPVVTLVLYFGNDKPWNGPLSLKERVDIPEELDPYVSDYKINLFQVSYLSREQADLFRSDFRVIADYFAQKRETGDWQPKPMDIAHMQDTLQLMRAITKDDRYVEVYESCTDEEKGGIRNMCDVLDRVENRGIQKGREEGRKEGREEGRKEGREIGKTEGEDNIFLLSKKLRDLNREKDLDRACEDKEYREQLKKEFGIS